MKLYNVLLVSGNVGIETIQKSSLFILNYDLIYFILQYEYQIIL